MPMKSCFDPITEIGETIERRGKPLPVQEESWETRGVVGMSSRVKPCLDVALHSYRDTEGLQRFLKPCSQREDKPFCQHFVPIGKTEIEAFVLRIPAFHGNSKSHFRAVRFRHS